MLGVNIINQCARYLCVATAPLHVCSRALASCCTPATVVQHGTYGRFLKLLHNYFRQYIDSLFYMFCILQLDSNWQRRHGVGQGLENQGATCYINSTVQCLVHNPIVANLGFSFLRQTCGCKLCALCYLGYRVRCSFPLNLTRPPGEAARGYPAWMINSGLATLGTLSRDRLSALKQV